jgi:hypothetical protein
MPAQLPTATSMAVDSEPEIVLPDPTAGPEPTIAASATPEPRTIRISFFPDINANGQQDVLSLNGKQAQMVSYHDLTAGLWGEDVDQILLDETFQNIDYEFDVDGEVCFRIKDGGSELFNDCQSIAENVQFTLPGEIGYTEEANAFLTITGLNTVGIGYVAYQPRLIQLPINEKFIIQTTTYEQMLGDQSSIIIKLPVSAFLEEEFQIGLKRGNHVLPFLPADIGNIQVKNSFDFSPDEAVFYDEFGVDAGLELADNGKDGLDFYPVSPEFGNEHSMLILAGMSGQIVFTDLPSRGVIEMCPALKSQKSCTSLARNQGNPEAVKVNIGGVDVGYVDSQYLFMEPGDQVDPGFPIAVMGKQGFDGGISLQYTHRYRYEAHNALPMIQISGNVIDGLNLREFPDAFVEGALIEQCPYSIFTVDPSGEFLLGFPEEADCQIAFYTWTVDGDEVFVPLPDAVIEAVD